MALNNNKDNDRRRRRGCMRMACGCWENYPYYTGPCPNADGCYRRDEDDRDEDCRCGRRRCRRRRRCDCAGIFMSHLPVALAANSVIPLVVNNPCRDSGFDVNSGLITVEEAGTYLATYNVRVPEGATMDTTITLNVDDASQTSAITQITSVGNGTSAYSAQAIFEADEGTTVSVRTSDAINITDPSTQPLVTLSLVQLEE